MKSFARIGFFTLLVFYLSSCGIQALMKKGKISEKNYSHEVPFELSNNMIIVNAEIGGKTRRFLFDSGAPNVISSELKNEMQYKVKKQNGVRDGRGERKQLDFVMIDDLKLGNIVFKHSLAAVSDFNQNNELSCFKIDGIIGANLMAKANWTIDYQAKTLSFTDKEVIEQQGQIIVPFRRKMQQTPQINIGLGNYVLKNLTFDTGSNGGVKLKTGMLKNPTTQFRSIGFGSSSLYGTSKDTIFYQYVNPFSLGGNSLGPRWIQSSENGSGTIGNTVWSDYLVTIDYQNDRILLEKRKETRQSKRSFGFVPRLIEDKWIIGSVIMESIAYDLGLRPGDEIIRINDKDYLEVNMEEYCRQYLNSSLVPKDDFIFIEVQSADEERIEKMLELEREEFFQF